MYHPILLSRLRLATRFPTIGDPLPKGWRSGRPLGFAARERLGAWSAMVELGLRGGLMIYFYITLNSEYLGEMAY